MISETLDAATDATDGFCALFLDAIQILHKVPLCDEQFAACYFCLRYCCGDRDIVAIRGYVAPPSLRRRQLCNCDLLRLRSTERCEARAFHASMLNRSKHAIEQVKFHSPKKMLVVELRDL